MAEETNTAASSWVFLAAVLHELDVDEDLKMRIRLFHFPMVQSHLPVCGS